MVVAAADLRLIEAAIWLRVPAQRVSIRNLSVSPAADPPDVAEIGMDERRRPGAAERGDDVRHGVAVADDEGGQRAAADPGDQPGRVGGIVDDRVRPSSRGQRRRVWRRARR